MCCECDYPVVRQIDGLDVLLVGIPAEIKRLGWIDIERLGHRMQFQARVRQPR